MGARNAFELLPDGPVMFGELDGTFTAEQLLRALSAQRDAGTGEVDFRALAMALRERNTIKRVQHDSGVPYHTLRALCDGRQLDVKHADGERLIALYRRTFVGQSLPRRNHGGSAK